MFLRFQALNHLLIIIRKSIVCQSQCQPLWNVKVKASHRPTLFYRSRGREMTTEGSSPTPTSTEENSSLKLFSFCKFAKLDKLSKEEKLIHAKHLEALQKGDELYEDPATGYSVLTRLAHLQRGKCCGNACRHCPYGQTGVPKGTPKKTYNSAFFV